MRVRFQCGEEQLPFIDEQALRLAAESALSLQLKPLITYYQRTARMPELTESSVTAPLAALATYLEEIAPERKDVLLERAEALCRRCESETQ